MIRVGTFNVQGIGGRDIQLAIDGAAQALPHTDPCLWAIAFQEVFFEPQAIAIRRRWVGEGAQRLPRGQVAIWRDAERSPWRALVPITPRVDVPGFAFDLSSGV